VTNPKRPIKKCADEPERRLAVGLPSEKQKQLRQPKADYKSALQSAQAKTPQNLCTLIPLRLRTFASLR
jgi:hypothetical protein